MDIRKVVLLVGALLVAGITALLARNMMAGSGAPHAEAMGNTPQPGAYVLVATKPLPVGTILDQTSVTFQPWPKDMLDKAYFTKGALDPTTLNGKVVRYSVTAGQPLTQGALVGPGERGFLAAALGPGMRAVTVSINATSGVGGFVFPGDRVDLMVTQDVAGGGDGAPLKVTETIVRNVRILAVDQRTSDAEKKEAQIGATVTLEVTPKLAEKIAVAQTIGAMSLSLRSIADNAAEIERAIAAGEIDVRDGQDSAGDRAMELALASRPSDSAPSFTLGAEVSRFQRSSVPGKAGASPMASAPTPGFPGAARPAGPTVRVTRGNDVTEVSFGAR